MNLDERIAAIEERNNRVTYDKAWETSWTRRGFDTVNGDSDRVYRRLTRSLGAGDILLLHDGHAARGPLGTPVIVEVLPRLLETLRARRLTAVTLSEAFS